MLNDELFVLIYGKNTINVYGTARLEFRREFEVEGLQFPGDIKTCCWNKESHLFVIDWTEKGKEKHMFILNKDGSVVNKWSMEDDYGRLSLTNDQPPNFIESFHDQNAIAEYTVDGKQIQKVPIPEGQGIKGLQHALKLNDGRFLLSHGDPSDDLHRVCMLDSNGGLLQSFGSRKGHGNESLNVPVHLAVDRKGYVLVADKYNNRIIVLNSELKFQRELIHVDSSLYPVKIDLEEGKKLLYVTFNRRAADMKMTDGQLMTFHYEA